MFGCTGSSLCGLFLAVASGSCYSSQCWGLCFWWLLVVQRRLQGSMVVGCAGLGAPRLWSLAGSGLEPVFPALMGRFFTTELKGKSSLFF